MKYETMKSFILVVLVGISFLLSFVLWSYRPNYDLLNDTNYVNEVDVGGEEKTKNELIQPSKIVFNNQTNLKGFKDPEDMQRFYKDMASWVLYDATITKANWQPGNNLYVAVFFPNVIPAELMTSLFTFNDEVEEVNWSFDRIYLALDVKKQVVDVIIKSRDDRRQMKATIDKSGIYQQLYNYLTQDKENLEAYITFQTEYADIYIPKEEVEVPRKTVTATTIHPDQFINALFPNPTLVTPNVREAYFTDGQRGMQVDPDNLSIEYINPIGANYERLSAMELIDKSVDSINEYKGWTNSFHFDMVNKVSNNIRYRMGYEGYPIFDNMQLSVIEQEWREQDLYNYKRPLIKVGNVLNSTDTELISGEEMISLIKSNESSFKVDNIRDIRIGYYLNMSEDAHSLTLEPNWFILYENEWVRFNADDYRDNSGER